MSETTKNAAPTRGRPSISDAKRQRMRKDIADIAKRLFQNEGYATVSMRRIAGEIGCSPMTLYKYYDAKIDILRTLWSDVFDELFKQLETMQKTDKTELQFLGATYVRYWLDHPEYYRLVFLADGVTQPDVSIFIDNPELVQRLGIFGEAISNACSSPTKPDALKEKLDTFLCFLNGIAHNIITISDYPWPEPNKMVRMAVSAVTK